MASYELRVGDTFPLPPVLLTDSSGAPAIDLTNATQVNYALKGITATLVTGVFKTGQLPITGTATANSATLASVTAVTGYANGATLTGVGIPAGTTVLSGAGTTSITMSAQANSLASGTPSTIVVNQGLSVVSPARNCGRAHQACNGFTTAGTRIRARRKSCGLLAVSSESRTVSGLISRCLWIRSWRDQHHD